MLRILVAEDFDILREDLCETLEAQQDMTVAGSAATGGEITRLALETDFDLVLMDIEMENITAGITATEVIREKKPEAMVIFLTAHETENTILTAMATGAVDYVVKGCSDEALLRHIRAAAAGQPLLTALLCGSTPACAKASRAFCSSSTTFPTSPPRSGIWCACSCKGKRCRRSPPRGWWRWSP